MRIPSLGREKEALRMAPEVLAFDSGRMIRLFMKIRKQTDYEKDEEWKESKKSEWPLPVSFWFMDWSPVEP